MDQHVGTAEVEVGATVQASLDSMGKSKKLKINKNKNGAGPGRWLASLAARVQSEGENCCQTDFQHTVTVTVIK